MRTSDTQDAAQCAGWTRRALLELAQKTGSSASAFAPAAQEAANLYGQKGNLYPLPGRNSCGSDVLLSFFLSNEWTRHVVGAPTRPPPEKYRTGGLGPRRSS
jgi:hypothetical protein